MKVILKNYYVTTDMIAEHWNKTGYMTEKNTQWNADKVTKKFRKILESIDSIIKRSEMLENLFRSENDEGSHFIFFDASQIMEYKQKLEDASIVDYRELSVNALMYYQDYETDTFDTLKDIFELWN